MGNLFMGFPVPRAKIAEMIEGYAPPLAHHTRHEATGDDEIPFQNLLNRKHAAAHAAGGDDLLTIPDPGMSNIFQDAGFHYKTFFPTLDELTTGVNLTGTVDHYPDKIAIATGTDVGAWAKILKGTAYQHPLLTYDKDIFIRLRFSYNIFAGVNVGVYIITSAESNEKHIGVRAYRQWLTTDYYDGGGRWHEEIIARPNAGAVYDDIVEIRFYTAEKMEYWINGTLELTVTENLPTGAFADTTFLKVMAHNTGTADNIYVNLSMFQIYQPAA